VRLATPHEITRARERKGFTRVARTVAIVDRPVVARAALTRRIDARARVRP
jgi:hypothetical protein